MPAIATTAQACGTKLPLRACVGIMMINRYGQVWLGRRAPKWFGPEALPIWQMPQGGIDRGEAPVEAAFRELEEETGAMSVELIGEVDDWLTYELPSDLLGIALKGRYRGQKQRWFAMRFYGPDAEIDIGPRNGHKAEFDAWRWADLDEAPLRVPSFKRGLYETVIGELGPLVR
ncbi:MAG: RNA pyrophosphohydrolase [Hyphomicrobiaceae bacterium]